jgi:hypothetical protein
MKYIFMFFLLVFSILAGAAVYMRSDQNGNITYSDTPTKGATIISLPDANTKSSSTPTSSPEPTAAKAIDEKSAEPEQASPNSPYNRLLIDTPLDKQTITNQQEISVTVVTTPELQKGDTIQIYLDGKPAQNPAATTTFTLKNIERGEHQIYALIRDQDGRVLNQSQTITVFIHYAHVGKAP